MNRTEALKLLADAPTGHLATIRPDGRPHVVVVTFALVGHTIVTAIDHKPKSTNRLQRLINIENDPTVSILVDHYSDDWTQLWWVRVDGTASIRSAGEEWKEAVDHLAAKYPQYETDPPAGPQVAISLDEVVFWASTP